MQCNVSLVLLLFFASVAFVSAGIFSRDPDWETLKVTWGLNLLRDKNFDKVPTTQAKALKKGWVSVGTGCSGKFLGYRFMKHGDPAVIMIYDNKGFVAGIQSSFPKSQIQPADLIQSVFMKSPLFIEDDIQGNQTYTLTAYTVEPEIICTTGRTKDQYEKQKTGTDLYLQNGVNPLKDYTKVPHFENETQATLWRKGDCFATMGNHYWYNVTKAMNCDSFMPVFLLYNSHKLTGFGWALQANLKYSERFEHPSKDNLDNFLDPVPRCLKESYDKAGGFTSLHIYFNSKPYNLLC